jgi:hypothetical protein
MSATISALPPGFRHAAQQQADGQDGVPEASFAQIFQGAPDSVMAQLQQEGIALWKN